MSKKITILSFFLFVALCLSLGLVALAQDEPTPELINVNEDVDVTVTSEEIPSTTAENEADVEEDVTAEDLGALEPTLLPDSRFYFLKEWSRSIKSAFTFGQLKKAELEAGFASERLLEARILALKEKALAKKEAIMTKVAEKYQKSMDKIADIVEKVKENASSSPAVSKFLDKFTEQQILHERILDKLEGQAPTSTIAVIQAARERHLVKFGEVMQKLEDKTQIKARLENAFSEMKGGEFKDVGDLNILQNFGDNLPEDLKAKIEEMKAEKIEKIKEKTENFSEEQQLRLQQYLEQLKGLEAKKVELIENLREAVQNQPNIQNSLDNLRERVVERAREIMEEEGVNCPLRVQAGQNFCPNGRVKLEKDANGCPMPVCQPLPNASNKAPQTNITPPVPPEAIGNQQGPQKIIISNIEVEAEPIR